MLLPWPTLVSFVRNITRPQSVARPVTVDEATAAVESMLARPNVVVPTPDSSQLARMRELLSVDGVGGGTVDDAFLAALALHSRATVVTFDTDFARFAGLAWERPAA